MTKIQYGFIALALIGLNSVALATFFGLLDVQEVLAKYESHVPPPRQYLAQECRAPECDFALLDSIIWCESKWEMRKNKSSSAYGYFQILDATERTTPMYQEGKTKYNPYDNIDMGIYLYERDGVNPWLESRPCWHWKYQGAILNQPNQCLGPYCEEE